MSAFVHHGFRGATVHWILAKLILWPFELLFNYDLSGIALFVFGASWVVSALPDLISWFQRKYFATVTDIKDSTHNGYINNETIFKWIPGYQLHTLEDRFIWHKLPDGHCVKILGEVISYALDVVIIYYIPLNGA